MKEMEPTSGRPATEERSDEAEPHREKPEKPEVCADILTTPKTRSSQISDPWESLEPLDPVLGGRFCRDSKPWRGMPTNSADAATAEHG